jgi:hypothetical protein
MNLRFSAPVLVLLFLSGFVPAVLAQDDLFITVSAPARDGVPSETPAASGTDNLFTTVSTPAASAPASSVVPPSPVPASSEAEKPALTAEPPVKKQTDEKWEQELLRDPFWPVGFFPPDWKKERAAGGSADLEGSGWKAAAGKIRISGTSRLGGKTAAIINGELKVTGDRVEIVYEGTTYRWQVIGIDANGKVQLKKQETR